MSDGFAVGSLIFAFFLIVVLIVGGGLWGCPTYNVYQQRMVGEAELAKANYTRQTAVVEAQARLDAASKLAEAEVARAHGGAAGQQDHRR